MKNTRKLPKKNREEDIYIDFINPYCEIMDKVQENLKQANDLLKKKRIYYKNLSQNLRRTKSDSQIEEEESHKENDPKKNDIIDLNNDDKVLPADCKDKSKLLDSLPDVEKIDVEEPLDNSQLPNANSADNLEENYYDDSVVLNPKTNMFSKVLKDLIEPPTDPNIIFLKEVKSKSEKDLKDDVKQIDYYSDFNKHYNDFKIRTRISKYFVVVEFPLPDRAFHPEDLIESLKAIKIFDIRSIEFGMHTETGRFNGFAYLDVGSNENKEILLKRKTVPSVNYIDRDYEFTRNFRAPKELQTQLLGNNQIQDHSRYYIQNLPHNFKCSDIVNMFYQIPVSKSPFVVHFISLYYTSGTFIGKCHVNISNELNHLLKTFYGNQIHYGKKAFPLVKNHNVRLDYYSSQ